MDKVKITLRAKWTFDIKYKNKIAELKINGFTLTIADSSFDDDAGKRKKKEKLTFQIYILPHTDNHKKFPRAVCI